MFLPAVIVASYYRLYIEALIYFFNMFFSTVSEVHSLIFALLSLQFYHACDQDLFNFCMFKYDGLQLSDFIGSYTSFVITLISMALIPRPVKIFLFIVGILLCVVINARERFSTNQLIVLLSVTFGLTVLSWVRTR